MDEIPHFNYPFRFTSSGHAETVEQGSDDDYIAQVMAVLKTPLGARIELLNFGISDQALSESGPNLREISDAINTWVPDFPFDVVGDNSELEDLVGRVRVSPKDGDDA